MTVKFYSFRDDRNITAPYGVFSKSEMMALMAAKTAKGRPLGRNAIRYWLYVLCHSSGRKNQPYRLNKKELSDIGLSKSSAYEAIQDLMHCGFIKCLDICPKLEKEFGLKPHQYRLAIPTEPYSAGWNQNSPKSQTKPKPKQSEISDQNSPKSQTIVHKVLKNQLTKKTPIPLNRGIEEIVRGIVQSKPWLIAGSINNSIEENKESLFACDPHLVVKALTKGGGNSLLRSEGYHGPQRKRAIYEAVQTVLDDLLNDGFQLNGKNEPEPQVIPPLDLPMWWQQRDFRRVLPSRYLHHLGNDDPIANWRGQLKQKMGGQYTIWFDVTEWDVVQLAHTGFAVIIRCPNRHFLEWIKQKYHHLVWDIVSAGFVCDDEYPHMTVIYVL
jgi:uncharacterized protein YjiS (DUF1127 family)